MKNIAAVYFSPTGGIKRACMALTSAMSQDVKEVDLCTPGWEWTLDPGDIMIMGIPVSSGRVPGFAAGKLKHCRGNGAATVTTVAYGNWVFEDVLLELDDCLRARGLRITTGAALLAERSMMGGIASGHPGEQDMENIRSFAVRILDKL